jgi:hypothetical protein
MKTPDDKSPVQPSESKPEHLSTAESPHFPPSLEDKVGNQASEEENPTQPNSAKKSPIKQARRRKLKKGMPQPCHLQGKMSGSI